MSFRTVEKDMRILERYSSGDYLKPEDKDDVERLASMGMMSIGVNPQLFKITAKTTSFGKELIIY